MKKSKKLLVSIICLLLMVSMLTGCGTVAAQPAEAPAEAPAEVPVEVPVAAEEPEAAESVLDSFMLDPTMLPGNTADYVILKGSWYEMGVQYGQQNPESLQYSALVGAAKGVQNLGLSNSEELISALKPYEELLKDYFPQLLDFCRGAADSTGLDYYTVLTGYVVSGPQLAAPESNNCSMVSAWGEATGGDLVAAYNSDRPMDASAYQATIIAFPDDGNAFICSRDLSGPTINSKGLVAMSTGGQHNNPEDFAFGIPYGLPVIYAAAFCDTAKEAHDHIEGINVSGDVNYLVADESGEAYVLETTSAHQGIRAAGDYGEKDYIIANNHFLTDEMQSSLYTDHSYDDCPIRYATVERYLLDDYGNITVNTLRAAEGSTRYYEDGQWKENVWDRRCVYNAPEALSSSFKSVIRHVANATTKTVYICRGQEELLSSYIPDSIGTFSQVTLFEDVSAIVKEAALVLGEDLFDAAAYMDLNGLRDDSVLMGYLDKAKGLNYVGMNYQNLAICSKDFNEQLLYFSKALNAYCDGQCYARLVSADPASIK